MLHYRKFAEKDIVFVVIDSGIGIAHAVKLVEEGYKTYYYLPWQSAFPSYTDWLTGYGFGMKKIKDPLQPLFNSDKDKLCFLFTDASYGYMADYFRNQGYPVCSGGEHPESLESDRVGSKKILKSFGIETTDFVVLQGKKEVEEFVKKIKKPYYIKMSEFRGDLETCKISDEDALKIYMDKLSVVVGPIVDYLEFILEPEAEGTEIGCDAFYNGEEYCDLVNTSFEINNNNFGYWTALENYEPFMDVLEKIKPFLKKYNYRGPVNFEGFWDGKVMRISDSTIRFSFPLSSSYPNTFDYWGKFLYELAIGTATKVPARVDRYYGVVNVNGVDSWMVIEVSDDMRSKLCWRSNIKIGNKVYAKPESDMFCAIVEDGKIIEEVCQKISDSYNNLITMIGGIDTKSGNSTGDFLIKVKKKIKEMQKYGIEFQLSPTKDK